MSDRPLPSDAESEAATLGAVLALPTAFPDVAGVLGPEDFYRSAHREIFEAMAAVDDRGEQPDVVAVVAELRRSGSSVDPMAVRDVSDSVPLPSEAVAYARAVARVAAQRRLVQVLSTALERSWRDRADPGVIAADLEAKVSEAVGNVGGDALAIGAILDEAVDALEVRGRDGNPELVPTGFYDLDRTIAGLGRGHLVVIAARPGVGKSALVGNLARNVAASTGTAMFFSLEMSRYEVALRLLCAESQVVYDRVRSDRADSEDWRRLLGAVEPLSALPLLVDDRASIVLPEIRAACRRARNLGLVVVDYLQLMQPPSRHGSNREQAVAETTRGLKILAKDLHVPVVAVAQLNRDPERRQDKRPQLSDLRESGAIEQDADVVILLHRDRVGVADAIVAKQRNGPTETVKLASQLQYARFRDWTNQPDLGERVAP